MQLTGLVRGALAAIVLLAPAAAGSPLPTRSGRKLSTTRALPDYALDYSPYVYLYSNESWCTFSAVREPAVFLG